MSYQRKLKPSERLELTPPNDGRPSVRIAKYVRLPCGRELIQNEEYPLAYCEQTESGIIGVIHFRTEPLDSFVRLDPDEWGMIDGFDYSLVPLRSEIAKLAIEESFNTVKTLVDSITPKQYSLPPIFTET